MKDLLVLGGILGVSYMLFGQKKAQQTQPTALEDTGIKRMQASVLQLNDGSAGSCVTCKASDGTFYTSAKGMCRMGDSCVSHSQGY